MASNETTAGREPGNPERIPATLVFAEPPGIVGGLIVASEHRDIVVHLDLSERQFCAIVLTPDAALSLSLWLCANVVDLRRR